MEGADAAADDDVHVTDPAARVAHEQREVRVPEGLVVGEEVPETPTDLRGDREVVRADAHQTVRAVLGSHPGDHLALRTEQIPGVATRIGRFLEPHPVVHQRMDVGFDARCQLEVSGRTARLGDDAAKRIRREAASRDEVAIEQRPDEWFDPLGDLRRIQPEAFGEVGADLAERCFAVEAVPEQCAALVQRNRTTADLVDEECTVAREDRADRGRGGDDQSRQVEKILTIGAHVPGLCAGPHCNSMSR